MGNVCTSKQKDGTKESNNVKVVKESKNVKEVKESINVKEVNEVKIEYKTELEEETTTNAWKDCIAVDDPENNIEILFNLIGEGHVINKERFKVVADFLSHMSSFPPVDQQSDMEKQMQSDNCKDRDKLMAKFTYPLDKSAFYSQMKAQIAIEKAKEAEQMKNDEINDAWSCMFTSPEGEERTNAINAFQDLICPEGDLTKEIFTKTATVICYMTEFGPVEEMDEDTKADYESQIVGRDELVGNFTFPVGKEGFVQQLTPWIEKKNAEEEAYEEEGEGEAEGNVEGGEEGEG